VSTKAEKLNLLVTLDENYIPYLNAMLFSLMQSNPGCQLDVYLLHVSLTERDTVSTVKVLGDSGRLIMIDAKEERLEGAPTTPRFPRESYYRIFAAKYLPETLDRVLYLDPDVIVNGSLKELYGTPLDEYYFAAASHNGPLMRKINGIRLDLEEDSPYINSGVLLMNLERLRREQDYDEVFQFIEKRKRFLLLPDQDIISSLYGKKIYALDPFRYNMTERIYMFYGPFMKELDLDWVRRNSVIIHYCGKNKPWKDNYIGQLDVFYKETVTQMREAGFIEVKE
jgi:lipopolysaccharide biosynthesis glycosyltransferase